MHFRQCDARLNAQGGRKTASAYDAIGAAQVAKASFSGMRFLHHLDGKVGDLADGPAAGEGSAVVEIYTRIYLRRAGMSGTKLRNRTALNLALEGLGSPPVRLKFEPNDHQTDALVTAAGMRQLATPSRGLSIPKASPPKSRRAKAGPSACYNERSLSAGLAQLVEQRFCKPKVAGSNPASGTVSNLKLNPRRRMVAGLFPAARRPVDARTLELSDRDLLSRSGLSGFRRRAGTNSASNARRCRCARPGGA